MTSRMLRTMLRKHLRSPRLYSHARRAMLLGQFIFRRPDEPDLKAFKLLSTRGSGLVIDIGANGGQSAIAFAFLLPKFRIVSFEPNPALWPDLDFVGRVIGERFGYRKLGLGSREGRLTLFVPQAGHFPITTRASLDRDAAQEHCVQLESEMGRSLSVAKMTVDVVTFDSLSLDPDAVKIDVEGFELEVLKGMSQTLARARPMVMLESNQQNEACADLLRGLNYRICYRDRQSDALIDTVVADAGNWFALPVERAADILRG